VSEEFIIESLPPIQRLMDHVFDNYSELEDVCEISGESTSAEECVNCHMESYYPGGSPTYECDNFKRVYVLRYLATQFAQNQFVIDRYVLSSVKSKEKLSAITLGGGPAPEALALMNALSSCDGEYTLSFDNIDSEASWREMYHDITHRFKGYVENVNLRTGFRTHDACSYSSTNRYDIVFISWILSEMNDQDRPKVLNVAGNLVTPEGYIVVMDSWEDTLVENVSELVSRNTGLIEQGHDPRCTRHCGVALPDELREVFKYRLNADTAYWVLRIV